jgi:hypothetical protein
VTELRAYVINGYLRIAAFVDGQRVSAWHVISPDLVA